jgi:transcription-repair coupling factor (superfamily II helicase)
MNIFKLAVDQIPAVAELEDELQKNSGKIYSLSGIPDAAKAQMIFGVGENASLRLVICEDEKKAKDRMEEYSLFDKETAYFPSKDILFYESDLRSNELSKERINTIERLISGDRITVFTTAEALMNRIPSKERFNKSFLRIKVGDELDLEDLRVFLIRLGYETTGTVEGAGEFSIRGGIVDIFPMTEDLPFRIEFFGDEVDSIRSFDVESQKSIERADEVRISPASEFLPDSDEQIDGMKRLSKDAKNIIDGLYAAHKNENAFRMKSKLENLQDLADRHIFGQEFEAYANYFVKDTVSLLDYFLSDSGTSHIFFDEPAHILNSITLANDEWTESMAHRLEAGDALPLQKDMLFF